MSFSLPPDVTFKKQKLEDSWVYNFHHKKLGELGRIVMQALPNGQSYMSCEVAGEPNDPMTQTRKEIFEPIGRQMSDILEATFGKGSSEGIPVPETPKAPTEVVESKLIPCDHCGVPVAMLIFAHGASTTAEFEDYARKMYPKYSEINVSTWLIGDFVGEVGHNEPSKVLRVWPRRRPILKMTPNDFNAMIVKLAENHCQNT